MPVPLPARAHRDRLDVAGPQRAAAVEEAAQDQRRVPDEHAVLVRQGVHAAEAVLPVVLLEALGEDLLEQRAGGGEGLGLERPGVRDADLGHADDGGKR